MTFDVRIDRPEDIAALDLPTARKALTERRELLGKVFQEAGDNLDFSKVTVLAASDGNSLAKQIDAMNDELGKVGEHYEVLHRADVARKGLRGFDVPAFAGDDPDDDRKSRNDRPAKSLGSHVIDEELGLIKVLRSKSTGRLEVPLDMRQLERQFGLKTIMSTSAGWAPETTRIGRVVLDEQRPIEILDMIPTYQTDQAAVVYMEETTFTDAAAERSEGGAYAEAALALTERSETVRSIGVSLPVTDEQIADVPGLRDYTDGRLVFMTRRRLDTQVLVGDGNAPNIRGTLNVSGINTQAKGADSVPDAVHKAITVTQVTGRADPNLIIMHPNDWQDVRLLKTVDGVYIWGSPADAGPSRMWGLPVAKSSGLTENTAIVGDYLQFAGLYVRQGVEVAVGYVNDDFTDGRVTLRCGLRAAMVHFRPKAFTSVTGI